MTTRVVHETVLHIDEPVSCEFIDGKLVMTVVRRPVVIRQTFNDKSMSHNIEILKGR